MTQLFGIDHQFITAYNPRADGLVERTNKEVSRRIKKEVNGSFDRWSSTLPMVQLALNIKQNDRIKSSAFEVIHGRPFNGFLDFSQSKSFENLQELITQRLTDNSRLRWYIYPELASHNKEFKKAKYDKIDEQVKKPPNIQPGDTVFAMDMTRESNWDPVYEGPFKVI